MPFEVVPQAIQIYPEDKLFIIARAVGSPIIWNSVGVPSLIRSDSRITAVGANNALVGQVLRSGDGAAQWIIGTDMIPSGLGFVRFVMSSGSQTMIVEITPSAVNVTGTAGSPVSFAHTVAPGHRFKLGVSGNTLTLFVNAFRRATFFSTGAIKYPFTLAVQWGSVWTTATPIIEAPSLTGDWYSDRANIIGEWTGLGGQAGGTFANPSANGGTLYTAGVNPGAYTIQNTVTGFVFTPPVGSVPQIAEGIITILPLSIFGESAFDVNPGEVINITTSYDGSQKKLVTFSIVSGSGTLNGAQFTAPTAPGTTVIRATYGLQRPEISVTVRPVVTPDKYFAQPGEIVNFTTNIGGSITWTADLGSPGSGGPSAGFVWTAPGISQLVAIITATNGTYTVSVEIPVLKLFPYLAHAPIMGKMERTTVISIAKDRTRFARVLDKDGIEIETYDFKFLGRRAVELEAVRVFWKDHFPTKRFIYIDPIRGFRKALYFLGEIAWQGDAGCAIDYGFRAGE